MLPVKSSSGNSRAISRQSSLAFFRPSCLAGHHQGASVLVQKRDETVFKNGVLMEDLARYEVGGALALLVNTAHAAFWIDITSLKSTCTLLTSTFQEGFRYRSIGTSVRQVMHDTVLDKETYKRDYFHRIL